MENLEKKQIDMQYNVKLFPIYKLFSWDLLFYYAINFLFFTTVKGLNPADVLLIDAFYPLFKLILQIPSAVIVNKFGNRKSLIVGNLILCSSILCILLANSLALLIASQLLMACGYVLKNLTETNLLFSSVENSSKKNDKFSKVDARGSALYYMLDAVTSLTSGFLFVYNGYLPIVFCFVLCVVSLILSCSFRETKEIKPNIPIKQNFLDIKDGFKFIFQSKRLKSLIIFYAIFSSVISLRSTLSSSLFTDISLPEQYFGIFYAIGQIVSSIGAYTQSWFHNRFRNRALTVFSLIVTFSMIAMGFCQVIGLNFGLTLEIILICLSLQCLVKGPYYTLIKRYLNSFSNESTRTKIYAANEIPYCITNSLLCFACSGLLSITNTSYVYIIVGCVSSVVFIFLLEHMKHTVGLKPEEYSKQEIEFTQLH